MFALRFLWDKLAGVRWKLIAALVLSVLGCVLMLATPYLSKLLVDDAISGGKTELVLPLVLLMVGMVVIVSDGVSYQTGVDVSAPPSAFLI